MANSTSDAEIRRYTIRELVDMYRELETRGVGGLGSVLDDVVVSVAVSHDKRKMVGGSGWESVALRLDQATEMIEARKQDFVADRAAFRAHLQATVARVQNRRAA